MEADLGASARRGFWLALILAGLSAAAALLMPVAGAAAVVFWAAIAWGIRRKRWAAAASSAVVMAVEIVVGVLHGASGQIAGFAVGVLFNLVCGYLFLRAALELKDTVPRGAVWPWATGLGVIALIWACVSPYSLPTSSMENTILPNESIVVEHVTPLFQIDPKRDQLVVFYYPVDHREVFVKRVAGIPGDRLKLVNKQLWRNGNPVFEPYVIHSTPNVDAYRDNFPAAPPEVPLQDAGTEMLRDVVKNGEVIVPPGNYFVMGDNRDVSLDSRYWGFVPRKDIIGRPMLIYSSYELESGGSSKMATAWNTRWNRLFRIP